MASQIRLCADFRMLRIVNKMCILIGDAPIPRFLYGVSIFFFQPLLTNESTNSRRYPSTCFVNLNISFCLISPNVMRLAKPPFDQQYGNGFLANQKTKGQVKSHLSFSIG